MKHDFDRSHLYSDALGGAPCKRCFVREGIAATECVPYCRCPESCPIHDDLSENKSIPAGKNPCETVRPVDISTVK